jgi:hypothetical protein
MQSDEILRRAPTTKKSHTGAYELEQKYEKNEVLQLFYSLTNRIEELERTVRELKTQQHATIKGNTKTIPKKEILDKLNNHDHGTTPFKSFDDFEYIIMNHINIDDNLLLNKGISLDELILEYFKETLVYIENQYRMLLYNNETDANAVFPIVYFPENHKHTMFVYSLEKKEIHGSSLWPQWSVFTNEHLQRLTQKIHVKLISQCNQWRIDNLDGDKNKLKRNDTLTYQYSDMISRICNVQPTTNGALMTRIKKATLDIIQNNTDVRLL